MAEKHTKEYAFVCAVRRLEMTENFLKILITAACVLLALGMPEMLNAATATGNLTISVIVITKCSIRIATDGLVQKNICDDGTAATLTRQQAKPASRDTATETTDATGGDRTTITLTY